MWEKLFWLPFWNRIIFFFFDSDILTYHVLLLWAKFHWRILLGKCFFLFCFFFFQILVLWPFSQNGNQYIGRHDETVNIFDFFFLIYGCFRCIQVWCKFLAKKNKNKNPLGKQFLERLPPPLLCTNRSQKYLMLLISSLDWNYWLF